MIYLTRAQILDTPQRTFTDVPVPEWGDGAITRVRSLTSLERDAFEKSSLDEDYKPNIDNYRARLAAASVCDDAGDLIFSEADAAALGAKFGSVMDRICDATRSISGMNKAELEKARKNS